jgi:hypothetical protein
MSERGRCAWRCRAEPFGLCRSGHNAGALGDREQALSTHTVLVA